MQIFRKLIFVSRIEYKVIHSREIFIVHFVSDFHHPQKIQIHIISLQCAFQILEDDQFSQT